MATIKDVAAYCHVAVSTVSRVINGHPDVSDDTRKKVMAGVQALHYTPNNSARDLAQTQGNAIGVVVRNAGNPFYSPIIRALGQASEDAGYTLGLHQITVDADEIAAAAALVSSKRLKGVILLGGRFDYTHEEAASIGVPFVCCAHANQFGDLDEQAFSSVSIDDIKTAYRATTELIHRGHTHIAILLDSPHDRSICELRYRGYLQALRDAGIEPDNELVILADGYSNKHAYEGTRALVKRHSDVTAIFSVSDTLALVAIKGLYDEGKQVPADCSVIGIDGLESSLYSIPTLTTLVQPQEELGKQAVGILVDTLEHGASTRHIRMQTVLREGGSIRYL